MLFFQLFLFSLDPPPPCMIFPFLQLYPPPQSHSRPPTFITSTSDGPHLTRPLTCVQFTRHRVFNLRPTAHYCICSMAVLFPS